MSCMRKSGWQYHLHWHPSKRKYLGRGLTKDVQGLYEENYRAVIKKKKKDIKEINKWKDVPHSFLGPQDEAGMRKRERKLSPVREEGLVGEPPGESDV